MNMIIDNELLAAYAEDNVSPEEREAVRRYLATNPDAMAAVMFATSCEASCDDYIRNLGQMLDEIEASSSPSSLSSSSSSPLPMTAMAAQDGIDNLCVIRCEGLALRHFGLDVTDEDLLQEARQQGWLQPEGTALHNIGRLSGTRGLSVSHRYHCSLDDIRSSLSAGNIVIAAVDGNELMTDDLAAQQEIDAERGMTPNHAVIVNVITEDCVIVTDPATPNQRDVYPLAQFLDAWEDSGNYLTVISNTGEYTPHPIRLDDIEVEDELLELQEAIAENAHEVWAETRRGEGWTYGPFRDDEKKQHPDMVPYNLLPESEKDYDRLMAMNTIRLVKKLGWELRRKDVPCRKPRSTHRQEQSLYSNTECRAIATLLLKMACADTRILPPELTARGRIYQRFGITYQHEQSLLPLAEACAIYRKMPEGKQSAVMQALHELAEADGKFDGLETKFIELIEKKG